MPVPVSDDQLAMLLAKVDKLVADKKIADEATTASNDAHGILQKAQADVATKDAAEASADGQVNVDVGDLKSFVEALAGT